jgi:hypothetical protein
LGMSRFHPLLPLLSQWRIDRRRPKAVARLSHLGQPDRLPRLTINAIHNRYEID